MNGRRGDDLLESAYLPPRRQVRLSQHVLVVLVQRVQPLPVPLPQSVVSDLLLRAVRHHHEMQVGEFELAHVCDALHAQFGESFEEDAYLPVVV